VRTYAYRLNHDLGFAPNPFFGWCTLACCMPRIRERAVDGDLIVGMAGSGKQGLKRIFPQLIYWMRVTESLSFDQYWNDARFIRKRPSMSAPTFMNVGDNTYRKSEDGTWRFESSMHYVPGSRQRHDGHVKIDTSVDRVLLSTEFTYWGGSGPKVPDSLLEIFPVTRGYKVSHDTKTLADFHGLIGVDNARGVVGDPADWNNRKYFN